MEITTKEFTSAGGTGHPLAPYTSKVWWTTPKYVPSDGNSPFPSWAMDLERINKMRVAMKYGYDWPRVPIVSRPMKGYVLDGDNRVAYFSCDGMTDQFTIRPVKKYCYTVEQIVHGVLSWGENMRIMSLFGDPLPPTFSRVIRQVAINERILRRVGDRLFSRGHVYMNEMEMFKTPTGFGSLKSRHVTKEQKRNAMEAFLSMQMRNPNLRSILTMTDEDAVEVARHGAMQVLV